MAGRPCPARRAMSDVLDRTSCRDVGGGHATRDARRFIIRKRNDEPNLLSVRSHVLGDAFPDVRDNIAVSFSRREITWSIGGGGRQQYAIWRFCRRELLALEAWGTGVCHGRRGD